MRDPYQIWMESLGLPIYRGHFVGDLRQLELKFWPERDCNAAFMELDGQEGVTDAWVTEIPAGKSLPPQNFAVDQLVYVVDGQGTCSIWTEGKPKKTFEWQKFSFFVVPGNAYHQFTNMQGNQTARFMHYSYLPLAMTLIPDAAKFLLKSTHFDEHRIYGNDDLYAEAKQTMARGWGSRRLGRVWSGNFFPDMRAWDKMQQAPNGQQRPGSGRGAGGTTVMFAFPESEMTAHMSEFPAGTYKKAHRHGPARIIIIPAGQGFSVLWEEGGEKIVVPWQESSVFTPPNQWFHQHFNTGSTPARYLALHPPPQFAGYSENMEDRSRSQIEYPDEDPMIRELFESELAKAGLKSLMPDEAYKDYNFVFQRPNRAPVT